MTEYSTVTRRRNTSNNSDIQSVNGYDNQTSTPPSRIPIKSPARSSKPVGGMAVAYSPMKMQRDNDNHNDNTNIPSDSYSKKLMELKNAMDLLKTPPAAPQSQPLQINTISYTPIKSSSLATNHPTSPFASAIDAIEISMASSSDTETNGNDTSLLDAYREDDSFIKNGNIYSSPQPSMTSSPFISSEELKKRLEATKEAFQRSLEAQKRRLRISLPFSEIDSSFSTCGYDSDLSVDSLKDTKNQLERIKKEMAEIIESDFEDVETIRTRNRKENNEIINNLIMIKKESWSSALLKYFFIFSITSIIFTYLFITYVPSLTTIQTALNNFLTSFEKQNILERIEETLNFLLQED